MMAPPPSECQKKSESMDGVPPGRRVASRCAHVPEHRTSVLSIVIEALSAVQYPEQKAGERPRSTPQLHAPYPRPAHRHVAPRPGLEPAPPGASRRRLARLCGVTRTRSTAQ